MKSYLIINCPVTTLGVNYLVQTSYLYSVSRLKVSTVVSYRYYSTSKSDPQSSDLPPVPIVTINNLNNEDCVKSSRIILKDKGVFILLLIRSMVINISEVQKIFI